MTKRILIILFSTLLALINFNCEGEDGINSLLNLSEIGPGIDCEFGGVMIESGLDSNNNGILDNNEIDSTNFFCNENELPEIYSAILQQSGTDSPTATVLKNDLDIEIEWSRIAQGRFVGFVNPSLDLEKTILLTNSSELEITFSNSNEIQILNTCGVNAYCDGFENVSIEIKVYD
ncbi:hypothetical protein KXJ69_07075 [Aureisphaera sp. CAU 1614]|uniref:DUF7151 domain-containing protein n=1 Tax=Halomarinibacterium sedimenti TaxID=2857106 RepID=A0A9X1JVL1_9FLAO|nr:hypothetical protein [Halomarinibacterium sedimenti]MBW2937865.1 hypothetical protein [Halomarinibacterium sedimenti]